CTVNDKLTFQAGVVALGNGNGYISINASRLKKLGLKFKDTVSVSLKKDESEFGMEMCEELKELLQQDEEGMRRFKMLTKGKQRYIIYYVAMVKSSQKRIDRAILLITNLKKTKEGKESFREMLGLKK
ncbi:MAG: YdeI/OmpD-associated family protein, partial [Bacteroidia bacterium]